MTSHASTSSRHADLSIASKLDYPIDLLEFHLSELKDFPLLTANEEVALARNVEAMKAVQKTLVKSRHGRQPTRAKRHILETGAVAHKRLVLSNAGLVMSVAAQYIPTGIPFMDLVQEGYIGLMKAIDKYDYRRGYRFSTYAKWWIWQSISRATSLAGPIRLPAHANEEYRRIRKAKELLAQRRGREPLNREVRLEIGLSPKKFNLILNARRPLTSLDATIPGSETDRGELVPDQAPGIEQQVHEMEFISIVMDGVSKLSPKQEQVLKMSLGLKGEALNDATIASKLRLSRERVRQLRNDGLDRLRTWIRQNGFLPNES